MCQSEAAIDHVPTRRNNKRISFFLLSAANDLPRLLKVLRLDNKGSLRSARSLGSETDGELGILLGREGTLGRLDRERRVTVSSKSRTEIGKTHVFVADLQFRGVLLSEICLDLDSTLDVLTGGDGSKSFFKVKVLYFDACEVKVM